MQSIFSFSNSHEKHCDNMQQDTCSLKPITNRTKPNTINKCGRKMLKFLLAFVSNKMVFFMILFNFFNGDSRVSSIASGFWIFIECCCLNSKSFDWLYLSKSHLYFLIQMHLVWQYCDICDLNSKFFVMCLCWGDFACLNFEWHE